MSQKHHAEWQSQTQRAACIGFHTGSLAAATLCKAIADTALVTAVPLLLGEYGVRFLRASGHGSFINQSIHTFSCVRFCLKTRYLIHIVDSLTLSSRPL